uniref:Ig-like domain-containing protein n=1 Tax=Macrostomum lignano TaxID=282301 RepID=A0A1I8GMR8_9PLAT
HRCSLIASNGRSFALTPSVEIPTERALTSVYSYVRLRSEFRLTVSASFEHGNVSCESRLRGTGVTETRQLAVPRFFYRCNTVFLMPEPFYWKDGSAVNLTVDSSDSNELETSHSCWLQSDLGNTSLASISDTNSSSSYLLNVSQSWGSEATLLCLVNQSGLFETWTHQRLPTVLFAASLNISVPVLLTEEIPVNFSVHVSPGQPTPVVDCKVQGSDGLVPVPLKHDQTGEFVPESSMHNGQLVCLLSQSIDEHVVYIVAANQSLNIGVNNGTRLSEIPLITRFFYTAESLMDQGVLRCMASAKNFNHFFNQKLTVYYPAAMSIILQDVHEANSSVNFSVSVSKGQPQPTVNCSLSWQGAVAELPLTPTLSGSFNVTKAMHNGFIRCDLTQSNGSTVLFTHSASRRLTVHHTSRSSWSAREPVVLKEGQQMWVTVESIEGNPEPKQRCWLQMTDGSVVQLKASRVYTSNLHLMSKFLITFVRRFNSGHLSLCEHSRLVWSTEQRSELMLTILTEEGNPRPELHCSLTSETVSIDTVTSSSGPTAVGYESFSYCSAVVDLQTRPANAATDSDSVTSVYTSAATTGLESTARAVTATASAVARRSRIFQSPVTQFEASTDAAPQAMVAASGSGLDHHSPLLANSHPKSGNSLLGLGLAVLAVVFCIGVAIGTYRCLIKSQRSIELVAIPLQAAARLRQQQQLEEQELRNSSSQENDEGLST